MGGWGPLREGLAQLFPAGEPSRRPDDGNSVNAQRRQPPRVGGARNYDGEIDRPGDRNQKYKPHRKHNRK